MRTGFVLSTIVIALALGFIVGLSDSRLLTRALIIGFAPTLWAASYVIERLTGRGMWHFTAPYPYRWMRKSGDATPTRRATRAKAVAPSVRIGDRSPLAKAA